MEHVAALLLIIGCSGDMSDCRELPAPVPVYETQEDCQGSVTPAIGAYTTSVPQVFAKCVPVDPALEEQDAELVWDIRPDGTIVAEMQPLENVMVASNSQRSENRRNLSQE